MFDENYNLLDMGWQPAPDVTFTKQKLSFNTINVKQEGFLFAYLSYDNDSNNWVYFDDFKVTHTPTNVLQYNEYYPFGLQTSNSWTRENSSNDYLYNAGNELNNNTCWYETFFRGYDPALGRFNQADPLAYASSSHTPYNYAFNDPAYYNDPMGDYPDYVYFESFEQSAGGSMFDSPMESKPWYRVGPGSGNNPMDGYRSVEGNARVMSHRQFNMFYGTANSYGVNEQRRYDVAQSAGQAPTQDDLSAVNAAFGTNFELNSSGGTGYWDMQYLYGGAGATWVSVGQAPGRPGPVNVFQNDQVVLDGLVQHFRHFASDERTSDYHLRYIIQSIQAPKKKGLPTTADIINYAVNYYSSINMALFQRTGKGMVQGEPVEFIINVVTSNGGLFDYDWKFKEQNQYLTLMNPQIGTYSSLIFTNGVDRLIILKFKSSKVSNYLNGY